MLSAGEVVASGNPKDILSDEANLVKYELDIPFALKVAKGLEKLNIRTSTVSYTHLDVYKRQALQGGVLTYAFDNGYKILADSSIWTYIYVVLIMMAGSMLAVWLGDQITNKGIGNEMCIRDR